MSPSVRTSCSLYNTPHFLSCALLPDIEKWRLMWRSYKVNKENCTIFVSRSLLWLWSCTLTFKSRAAALVTVELWEPGAYPSKAYAAILPRSKTQGIVSAIPATFYDFLQTRKQTYWKALLHFLIKRCF